MVKADECFEKFEKGESYETIFNSYSYSGKGINEEGKVEACKRAQMKYYVLVKKRSENQDEFHLGICLPLVCDKENLNKSAEKYGFVVEELPDYKISNTGLIFLMFLLVFVFTCIISTGVEYVFPNMRDLEVIKTFSSYSAFNQLFQTRPENDLSSLNGLKVISFLMVIYGHVFVIKPMTSLLNVEEVQYVFKHWWGVLAYTCFFAVDIFFVLSGFLLSYFLLIQLHKYKKVSFFLLYLHRVLRILPVMLIIIGIDYFLIPSINSSPTWKYYKQSMVTDCDKNWWSNALFINNFYPNPNTCFGVGWYLANDMQFFIISPIIVYLYFKTEKKFFFWIFSSICFVSVFLISFFIAKHYEFGLSPFDPNNIKSDHNSFDDYYIRPYVRFSPYLQGIILGILYYQFKNPLFKGDFMATGIVNAIDKNKFVQGCLVVCGFLIMITSVTIQLPVHENVLNDGIWSRDKNALVMAYIRFSFTFGLALVMLPTLMGKIGFLNSLLSLSLFEPLSKLTYSGYLIHLSVLTYINLSAHHSFLSGISVLREFLICSIFTLIIACFIYVWIEIPLQNLESLLISKFKKPNSKETVNK